MAVENERAKLKQQQAPRPVVAVLVSLVAPGAGHVYAGRFGLGLALGIAGPVVSWVALLAGLGASFLGVVLWVFARIVYYVALAIWAWFTARAARSSGLRRRRWWLVAGLAVAQFVLVSLPIELPHRTFSIPAINMAPTLQVGDRLMADMRAWEDREPQRGDLVIYREPAGQGRKVGRVVGLPGERIEVSDQTVYIDGEPLDEPWVSRSASATPSPPPFGPLEIPNDAVFVLGDNLYNSRDSRFFGPVDRSLLLGRPLYVFLSRDPGRIGHSLTADARREERQVD